jgi:thiamine kinase-like enzyme/dTDP-glucose pyrophosphorylase
MNYMSRFFLGPMTKNVVDCVIDYANNTNTQFTFIPSRRQIDFDSGYVNNWTTAEFSSYVRERSNNIFIERDHGGVNQGTLIDDGVDSFYHDCRNFDIIHIDPWKKYSDYNDGLAETIRNIKYCYSINPNILYEIGTEETIRKFDCNELEQFILDLKNNLDENIFCNIRYLVIQCGTKLKECSNSGIYDKEKLINMVKICNKYNLISKEHNGDWTSIGLIKEKFQLGLSCINIAPELGQIETSVILEQIYKSGKPEFFEELFQLCLQSNKWVKWVSNDFQPEQNKEKLIHICCHYIFSNKEFKILKNKVNDKMDELIKIKLFDKLRDYHSLLDNYYKVLITTSGIGSRLGNMTKFNNKSLIKVGDKFGICYIIERYNPYVEFVITIGYYGHIVKQFLLMAYPTYKFTFVEVDNYVGHGSSLGYSLLQAKHVLNCPFMFHCCDSIVLDSIDIPHENTIYVNYNLDSSTYATVSVNGDKISNVYDKGQQVFDYAYIGISFIKDYKTYWEILYKKYIQDKFNSSLGDVDILKDMCLSFKFKVMNEWFDTGSIKEINTKISKSFKCVYDVLPKLDESICFLNNHVIKYFYDSEKCQKIVSRGKLLYPFTPKIHDYSDNFIKIELVEGELMSKNVTYGEINHLLEWANEKLWISPGSADEIFPIHHFQNTCLSFYKDKTLHRVNQILPRIKDCEIVNKLNVGKIHELLNKIDFQTLIVNEPSIFHGDFILDNIIKTGHKDYVLIDWREDFGGILEYGDKYYDLAKLRHNIIMNHNNIMNKLYTFQTIDDTITVDLKCNYLLIQQLNDFDQFILNNSYDLKKIKIITSLIWLNMSPLYEYPLSDFLFYFGKYSLYIELITLSPNNNS